VYQVTDFKLGDVDEQMGDKIDGYG